MYTKNKIYQSARALWAATILVRWAAAAAAAAAALAAAALAFPAAAAAR
jgi:hypothetical protein